MFSFIFTDIQELLIQHQFNFTSDLQDILNEYFINFIYLDIQDLLYDYKIIFTYTDIQNWLNEHQIHLLVSDAPLFGNFQLSLTNIVFYLTIGAFFALILNILATNLKVVSNNWFMSQKSLYALKRHINFLFISLYVIIKIGILIGLKSNCLAISFNDLILGLAFFFIRDIIKIYIMFGFYIAKALGKKSLEFVSRQMYTLNNNKSYTKFKSSILFKILKSLIILCLVLCLCLFLFVLSCILRHYICLFLGYPTYLECAGPRRPYVPMGYDIPDVAEELYKLDRLIEDLLESLAGYHEGPFARRARYQLNYDGISCAKEYEPRLNPRDQSGQNITRAAHILIRQHKIFRRLKNSDIDS